jgi:nicotinamide-nucleotide amidase
MNVSIISIGNELLNGKTVNTNASFIGKEISKINGKLKRILTVEDNKDDLIDAFNICSADSTIIICSGGLGPTNDDKTRDIVADYFCDELICYEDEIKKIEELFKKFNRPVSDINRKQAFYPTEARLFENKLGTASGFCMTKNTSRFYFVPGVPYEMKHLMSEQVLPEIIHDYPTTATQKILLYRTANIAESMLYEKLLDIIESNDQLEFAFYPNFRKVDVYARGTFEVIQNNEEKINHVLLPYTYSNKESTELVDVLAEKLNNLHWQLSVAESCTGGLLAANFVSKSGASRFFKGGIIAYSNEVKRHELAVQEKTLSEYGAVSEECVKEMAMGTLNKFKTDVAISISGIAGPEGGTDEKPVGTVCLAVATPNGVTTTTQRLGNTRDLVQKRAVHAAEILLWKELINY